MGRRACPAVDENADDLEPAARASVPPHLHCAGRETATLIDPHSLFRRPKGTQKSQILLSSDLRFGFALFSSIRQAYS